MSFVCWVYKRFDFGGIRILSYFLGFFCWFSIVFIQVLLLRFFQIFFLSYLLYFFIFILIIVKFYLERFFFFKMIMFIVMNVVELKFNIIMNNLIFKFLGNFLLQFLSIDKSFIGIRQLNIFLDFYVSFLIFWIKLLCFFWLIDLKFKYKGLFFINMF